MAQLFDWQARCTVKIDHRGARYPDITYSGAGNTVEIEIVTRHDKTIETPVKKIHGLKAWNRGMVDQPPNYGFTLEVPGNTQAALILQYLQQDRIYFDLFTEEDDTVPEELQGQFVSEVELLGDAKITRLAETFEVDDVPMYRFEGTSLRASIKGGEQKGNYPYALE